MHDAASVASFTALSVECVWHGTLALNGTDMVSSNSVSVRFLTHGGSTSVHHCGPIQIDHFAVAGRGLVEERSPVVASFWGCAIPALLAKLYRATPSSSPPSRFRCRRICRNRCRGASKRSLCALIPTVGTYARINAGSVVGSGLGCGSAI